jgi:ribosomal protein L11 methyltransferase
MDYVTLNLVIEPPDPIVGEIMAAFLAEIGFDSFEEVPGGLNACIQATSFDEDKTRKLIESIPIPGTLSLSINRIPAKNWNEEWEKSFQPVIISDRCMIRASFHEPIPEIPYTIVIDPKMAFGTGHHETTSMMVSAMLDLSFTGKAVLDMGTGTGVLAILASMLGAARVIGVDIDEWSCTNAAENILLNKSNGIQILRGDLDVVPEETYDVILANINRNILLDHLSGYYNKLKSGGVILLSGFLSADVEILVAKASQLGLTCIKKYNRNTWNALLFMKN